MPCVQVQGCSQAYTSHRWLQPSGTAAAPHTPSSTCLHVVLPPACALVCPSPSLLLFLLLPPSPASLVKRAMHGTRMMSWQEIRQFYGREVVNLRHEGRWVFLNTLFSVSEAVMYMQVCVCVHDMSTGRAYTPSTYKECVDTLGAGGCNCVCWCTSGR